MSQLQLQLFQKPVLEVPVVETYKPRYYKDLSIHEKINVKTNSQLPRAVILQGRKGFDQISPITRSDHPEAIQWKIFRFHMIHNHGGVIRLTKSEIKNRARQIEEYRGFKLSY